MLLEYALISNILAFAVGALIWAFFSYRLRKFRKVIFLIGLGLSALVALFLPGLSHFILFCTGVFAALWLLRNKLKEVKADWRKKRRAQTALGTSKWATQDYLAQHAILQGEGGLFLGNFEHGDGEETPMHYTGDRHLLTVAPTRAGKGVSSTSLAWGKPYISLTRGAL